MSRYEIIEGLLKKYKYNNARKKFLECQLKHLTLEGHNEYNTGEMYKSDYSGVILKFILDNKEEDAKLNKVEETVEQYKDRCYKEFLEAREETENELKELNYYITLVEDGLNMLEIENEKYKLIIEGYYINNSSMENIADSIHISRSRCYELRKEAVKWITMVMYGNNALI